LGDIHEEGLLLLTPMGLGRGNRFNAAIKLPAPLGAGREAVNIDIEVRWSRKDSGDKTYQNGCSFVSLEPGDREFIVGLVEKIGFSDGHRKIVLKNDDNIFVEQDEGSGHHGQKR
ncbi:MAG: hypothetical protein JXM71_02785, partial [Spirochaetales bacterium]|nr:hypothetical protein [Spirochaetales bacterium]